MTEHSLSRRAFLRAASASAAALWFALALPDRADAAPLPDPYAGSVPMTMPLRRGVYRLANNWHVPRVGSIRPENHQVRPGLRAHDGVDIYAARGATLYACASGIVVASARPYALYGNAFWIQTGAGYRFFYSHLDRVFIKAGQTVTPATAVGTVGNTGNAARTPAHLHLEIHYPHGSRYTCARCRGRKPATAINPYPSLLAARARP